MNKNYQDILFSNCFMSEEEMIQEIYDNPTWKSYTDDRLCYKEYSLPENVEETIDTLIEWFLNNAKPTFLCSVAESSTNIFLSLFPAY